MDVEQAGPSRDIDHVQSFVLDSMLWLSDYWVLLAELLVHEKHILFMQGHGWKKMNKKTEQ